MLFARFVWFFFISSSSISSRRFSLSAFWGCGIEIQCFSQMRFSRRISLEDTGTYRYSRNWFAMPYNFLVDGKNIVNWGNDYLFVQESVRIQRNRYYFFLKEKLRRFQQKILLACRCRPKISKQHKITCTALADTFCLRIGRRSPFLDGRKIILKILQHVLRSSSLQVLARRAQKLPPPRLC